MFRDKEEELQRLEQLLAQAEEEDEETPEEYEQDDTEEEYTEEDFDEEELIEEFLGDEDAEFDPEATQIFSAIPEGKIYNNDRCDVELEEFSDDVFSGPRKSVLPWVFLALTVAVLLVLYLALQQAGYLG